MRQAVKLPLLSDILVTCARPRHDRRLTDKIAAAFNHAYASGETGIATLLRRALEAADVAAGARSHERRPSRAVQQADRWVQFVEARNAYNRVCELTAANAEEVERARREMLAAYKRWREG